MPRGKKTLTKDTATKSKVAAKEKAAEPEIAKNEPPLISEEVPF